jgi:hypothetical protein
MYSHAASYNILQENRFPFPPVYISYGEQPHKCEVCSSHGGYEEDYCILGCDTM